MDFNIFLNQQITNKKGDFGIVISFSNEEIVVRYACGDKSYNPQIAFKNNYLSFKSDTLNVEITSWIKENTKKQDEEKKEIEHNNELAVKKYKTINTIYKELSKKNRVMQSLFGSDFKYPPFEEFCRVYKLQIDKPKRFCDRHYYLYY